MTGGGPAALSAIVLCAFFVRTVFPRLEPGAPRLLAALPVVAANCVIPCLFDDQGEFLRRGCLLLLLTWLATFKTLGYALNRGPLKRPLTALQFVLVYAMPITPQEPADGAAAKSKSNARLGQSAGGASYLAAKTALKLALLLADVALLSSDLPLPVLVREVADAFCLYWFLGCLMDGPGAALCWAAGLRVAPHFDAPYLSASVSEFWSKRWNLTVGNSLRLLTYDPIMEGRLVSTGAPFKYSQPRRLAAICAAFLVSGLMHEGILWFMEPAAATGLWMAYFALQAPVVIAESLLKKAAKRAGQSPPRLLAVPLTLVLLFAMTHCLFFPPAIGGGLDRRFFASVRYELGLPPAAA